MHALIQVGANQQELKEQIGSLLTKSKNNIIPGLT